MKTSIFLAFFLNSFFLKAQQPNANLLDTLNQFAQGNTISKHFAKVYYDVIEATNSFALKTSPEAQQAIFSFEQKFASLFFKAHHCYTTNKTIPWEWKKYYSDTTFNKHQYIFMGMNAHINGNLWDAFVQSLPYDTLRKYKKLILDYQNALNPIYNSLYKETLQYKKVKAIQTLSLGLAKKYGSIRMLHWRKKQIDLALMNFKQPLKFNKKLSQLKKKMLRLDRLMLRWLK